ncbi:hypothetical protein CISG_02346 [Coccidioides immitis RMSCC 3703]|uniref:Uncharacterized protein n=1 Tax=Coccidioides immitis RMSCC 3703 TaxID=454286 RepID=A0A0J8R7U0_COCIT|nr:hypothetical protein CISG_02346 [Coccidioides immitis RMSCC 3703]
MFATHPVPRASAGNSILKRHGLWRRRCVRPPVGLRKPWSAVNPPPYVDCICFETTVFSSSTSAAAATIPPLLPSTWTTPWAFSHRPPRHLHSIHGNPSPVDLALTTAPSPASAGVHRATSSSPPVKDSRLRVWDATTGANTLVHFGPRIRNSASMHLAERAPLVVPDNLSAQEAPFFLWPNYSDPDDRGEIFVFSIRNEGELVTHLKVPGILSRERMRAIGKPSALTAARINTLTWRGNGGAGEGMEMFSGHGDGTIRCWASRTEEEIDEIEAEREETEIEERKRKRDVLEELYRGLMQPGVTFT